jgi:hypothetical protein
MSENLLNIAHSLDKVREQLRDINPQIDGMVESLEGIQDSLITLKSETPGSLNTARLLLVTLGSLLVLTQVPGIYNGYHLFSDLTEKERVKETEVDPDIPQP